MSNEQSFIDNIALVIVKECKKRGYKFPSAIIGQACLESAFGRSKLSAKYHNYFGLKCGPAWKGACVNLSTMEEYKPGVLTAIKDNFRVYADLETGVAGYFDFIAAKRYNNLKGATSSLDYLQKIRSDGYASSYNYVRNVYSVVVQYNLSKYDPSSNSPSVTEEKKYLETVVNEVIAGKWGNGNARKIALTNAGYDYVEVQEAVNKVKAKKK